MAQGEISGLTRRSFLGTGAVAGLGIAGATLLSACGTSDNAEDPSKQLTIGISGGEVTTAFTKAWSDPFIKANRGVTVVPGVLTSEAQIQAMVMADNVTWDLAITPGSLAAAPDGNGLYEPIDYSVVDATNVPDLLKGKYRVAASVSSTLMAYRTDMIAADKAPQSWTEFFDSKNFPGRRGMIKTVQGGMAEVCMLAAGVPADELYPIDTKIMVEQLDRIKDDAVWWGSGSQSEQQLTDGSVSMAMAFNGRAAHVKSLGAPISMVWNQNLSYGAFFLVPKGARNAELAMKYISFALRKENNALPAMDIPYGPSNSMSIPLIDPSVKADVPSTHADQAVYIDDAWWTENLASVDAVFQKWLVG